MHGPREVLNELKWRDPSALARAAVRYVHRGAPGDERSVSGSQIAALHASFMGLTDGAMIPFHRIFSIESDGARLWVRSGHGREEKH
ncbi:MAG: DUF504 domain-containing protein [Thermoplasmatota archaeon]